MENQKEQFLRLVNYFAVINLSSVSGISHQSKFLQFFFKYKKFTLALAVP